MTSLNLRRISLILIAILVLLALSAWQEHAFAQSSINSPQDCTVFYASNDQVALGGNNEDGFNPRTKIWFLPAEKGKYGAVVVGYEDLVRQGGVNDHGMFFDVTAVTPIDVPQEEGKPVYAGDLSMKALTECATVNCVLQLYDRYNRGGAWNGQLLFGDSTGNSVIIEPLANISKQGQFQVMTNFLQSTVKPEDRTDKRYNTAMEMLQQADHFSVELFRTILEATHQAKGAQTVYSTIYDLKQGIIYLYYFHDFEHVVEFDLKNELANGMHVYDIPSLFPDSPSATAFGESVADRVASRQSALQRVQVDPKLLSSYAGKYEYTADQYFLIKSEGSRIFGRDISSPWLEFIPLSDTHFVQVVADWMGEDHEIGITFQATAGRVTGLEYEDEMGNKYSVPKAAPSTIASPWIWVLVGLLALGAFVAGLIIWRGGLRRLSTSA